ncbi:amino acid ABC transporter substrate-binding protein, partial [Klebsiella pneumoniae]|nr:amino acid ABC transporter substrate-binding protein [Klebsiella pneumoniae]
MKRLITIILIIAAVFSVITGCSKPKEKEDNTLVIGIDDKFAPMGFR